MHEMRSHPFQTRGYSSRVLTATASQGVEHGADPAVSSATGASVFTFAATFQVRCQLMFQPIPGGEGETHETNSHQTPRQVEQGEIQAGVYSPMRCGGRDVLM